MAVRILISGAGIAGPTLAYWLSQYGFTPTIVEIAPRLRTGGYVIDFWGAGFDVADRMGLIPELRREGYMLQEVRVVNRKGERIARVPAAAFAHASHGRYLSLPRSDLAATIFRHLGGNVETIFGDSIESLRETESGVRVTFSRAEPREFDLVIGADGLHSRVRELVFGPESRFERYLGMKAAAFQIEGYRPRDELIYVMYTEVGRQIARFSMRDDRTLFLLTLRDQSEELPRDLAARKSYLRERYNGCGWEWPQIAEALDRTTELYFDRVSQIRMSAAKGLWTRGRVALVGDAAFCVSLLAGQGSALAMAAACILAGELHRAKSDFATAFKNYEALFGPFVLKKQTSALRLASSFAPKSQFSLFIRNQIMNLLQVHWIADVFASRGLMDNITLPEY